MREAYERRHQIAVASEQHRPKKIGLVAFYEIINLFGRQSVKQDYGISRNPASY
jgi:hypothetical protein